MTVVLVVVIVLLLVLFASGTLIVVRRRDRGPSLRRPSPREPAPPPPPGEVAVEPPPAQAQPPPLAGPPPWPEPPSAEPRVAVEPERAPEAADQPIAVSEVGQPAPPRLRDRIGRARAALRAPLGAIRRRERVDAATFDELEEALLLADVGLPTTERLLDPLRRRAKEGSLAADPVALLDALRADAAALFAGDDRSLHRAEEGTTVWLFVGVNGAGKTTTIGKLAAAERGAGRQVVVAAGDTFRAAAGEQIERWAERAGAAVVRGAEGADPSSVVFDAVQHAAARSADVVMADTAGRLHTKVNLMEELRKVRRVADRPPGHVSEVLLVLDATTGQNALAQARQFTEAAGVTGIVLTKLDGTAKGGVVLAIRAELGLPIKLVGIGEGPDDLVAFDPDEFVSALFD